MNLISISQMKQIAVLVIMMSLAIVLISACAPSTTRVDPLASLNLGATTRPPEYKDLSLAMILSDNTRNTAEQLQKWNGMMVFNQAAQVDIDTVFKGIADIFRENFLNVTAVQNIEDAQKLNVDLIAMLDINMELSNFRWNPTKVEISSILFTPGKTEIDTVRGKGTRKGIEGGHGEVALSISDAQINFGNALIASNKLHAFRNAKLQVLAKTAVKSSAPLHKDSPGLATQSSGALAAEKTNKSQIKTVDNYLAVFDFEVTTGDKGISRPLADRVIHVFSQSEKYEVIDRGNMNKILGEQKFQMSGCVAQECKVEAGQILGVGKIVNGSVGLVGKTYYLTLQLIDVKTGKVELSAEDVCKCEIDDLLGSTMKLAKKLLGEK